MRKLMSKNEYSKTENEKQESNFAVKQMHEIFNQQMQLKSYSTDYFLIVLLALYELSITSTT